MICYKRLPLTGLVNARDLGGFPTEDGKVTKYGVFIRSELPAELTEADIDFLLNYGVRLSIDVRGERETKHAPSVLSTVPQIHYENISMFDERAAAGAKGMKPLAKRDFQSWGKTYIEMMENGKEWAKKVVMLLAKETGVGHYHCTTGKDRTGMITAMLLGLCQVADEDIISDYCISQVNMRAKYLQMAQFIPMDTAMDEVDLNDPFFSTSPENMFLLLQHIRSEYGSMETYLKSCHIEKETLEQIKKKLIE